MAVFSLPSLVTVENILKEIYSKNAAEEEFRFYEVYNVVLTQVIQALKGKGDVADHIRDEITLAPQYVLEREALNHPIDIYGYRKDLGDRLALKGRMKPTTTKNTTRSDADELEEAENYLAEASMEVHLSDIDEDISAIRDIKMAESDSDSDWDGIQVSKESLIPDFIAFHITSRRRTLLIVEIKPDVPLTQKYVKNLHKQARLQAAFAFEIFPAERTIYSLMLIGRRFYLKIFEKASCTVPHHLLKHFDEEPFSPRRDKKRGKRQETKGAADVYPTMWQDVFTETVTKSKNQTKDIRIRGLTLEFKEAMNTVMTAQRIGEIQWGDC